MKLSTILLSFAAAAVTAFILLAGLDFTVHVMSVEALGR